MPVAREADERVSRLTDHVKGGSTGRTSFSRKRTLGEQASLATPNNDVVDVPGRHEPRINVDLSLEPEPDPHARILVGAQIISKVCPSRIENGLRCRAGHVDMRFAPNGNPGRTIEDFNRVDHPRVPIRVQPTPIIEHVVARRARIDDGARQVIKPVRSRDARVAADDDPRNFVVDRRRMIGGRVGIASLMARRSRRGADLPFRTQGPTIPVVSRGGRSKRLFIYRDRTATRQRAIGTRHDAIGTRSSQSGRTRRTTAGIAIVDRAIAIIIETVANLGRRRRIGHTDERPALALKGSLSAHAGLTRHARSTTTRIAFVRRAIAIVVESVANLIAGLLGLSANECSVRTRARPRRTYPGQTRRTSRSTAGIALVNETIAIVVFVVARLRGRLHRLNTNEPAVLALKRSGRTNPGQRSRARATTAGIALVNEAVAVVVLVVARFRRRLQRLYTNEPAVLALERSGRTNPRQGRRT